MILFIEFLDKENVLKGQEPYYVYMTAGANKFLRIYYGRVERISFISSRILIIH